MAAPSAPPRHRRKTWRLPKALFFGAFRFFNFWHRLCSIFTSAPDDAPVHKDEASHNILIAMIRSPTMNEDIDYFEYDLLRPSCYTLSLFEQYEPQAANDNLYGEIDAACENLYPAIA
jgi:hypothetical protein